MQLNQNIFAQEDKKEKVVRLILRVLVLIGATHLLLSQNVTNPTVRITSARVTRTISLEISVSSAEKTVGVPFCGIGEGETAILCNLGIHIEIQTQQGWAPIKPRYRNVVLGGVPSQKWNFRVIPAGERRDFFFAFTKEDFDVKHGQRLRVLVDTWPDEQSMKNGGTPTRITSSSFACP